MFSSELLSPFNYYSSCFKFSFLSGSGSGMLLFFLGTTIGIMSTTVANKSKINNLNELLKQNEALVEDLQEELKMKDLLTVEELTNEGSNSQGTNERSFVDGRPTAFSKEQELNKSTKSDGKDSDDEKPENCEALTKIEAELAAELERLELNMKSSRLEIIFNLVKVILLDRIQFSLKEAV